MQQSLQLAWGPTIHPTNLAITQVIAAVCCVGHICMVGGGGGGGVYI